MRLAGWLDMVRDWAIGLFIAGGILVVWQVLAPHPVSTGPAPPMVLDDLTGQTFSLHDDDAVVTVVNFWATWCAPCRAEIPEFSNFAERHPEVRVLGVSVDQALHGTRLAAAARRLGVTYTVLHDADQAVARSWGVQGYPTTFVLNAQDHVVEVRTGMLDVAALERMVSRARSVGKAP